MNFWKLFTRWMRVHDAKTPRCNLCGKETPSGSSNLLLHLRHHHPQVDDAKIWFYLVLLHILCISWHCLNHWRGKQMSNYLRCWLTGFNLTLTGAWGACATTNGEDGGRFEERTWSRGEDWTTRWSGRFYQQWFKQPSMLNFLIAFPHRGQKRGITTS